MNSDFFREYQVNKLKYQELTNDNMIGGDKNNKRKEIYILRHGESEANEANVTQGSEYDTGLTSLGREQSEKTGKYLKKYRLENGDFDAIYSSPLKRATETAEIIKDEIGFDKDITFDDRLVERSKGRISGLDKGSDEVQAIFADFDKYNAENKDPIENFNMKFRHEVYQKVSKIHNIGGESDYKVEKRAAKVLDDIVNSDHSKILIVSHGGLLMALIRIMVNATWSPYISGGNCWIAYATYGDPDKESGCRYRLESPPNRKHLDIV
jgi:broad specificity phosphatase PhoE